MFAFQWREFSPPLSSAHRLLQCYHSQWEIGDAAIPPQPPATIVPLATEQAVSSDVAPMLILVGKICIIFFLFHCEGMLSLVVLWLCVYLIRPSRSVKTLNFDCIIKETIWSPNLHYFELVYRNFLLFNELKLPKCKFKLLSVSK